jgi:anti-sigma regulatory factor (Ser/Thr protein kinase)
MTHARGKLSFELTNDLAEMSLVAEHLEQFGTRHGISPDVLSQVNLALDEIVTHIAHRYGDGGIDGRIRINLAHDGASLTARIEDDAAAFDPLERDDPSLGIQLVKTLVDEITYSRERDQNVLVIRKIIGSSAARRAGTRAAPRPPHR